MPRLFTGIEIPADLRARLALLGGSLPGARWISPENMHITLCFAGDIDDRRADDWADQLAMIDAESFDITIAGLGTFGGRRPRNIWARVECSPALQALRDAHLRAARAVGIIIDDRRFQPHVTLARLPGADAGAVASYLSDNAQLRCDSFTVERLVLLGAKPGTGGGPYVVEDNYPLRVSFRAFDNDN